LLQAIAQHYPVTELVGHEHVAPGRKADPGAGFDWVVLSRQPGFPLALKIGC
jgi:AmpD protein